MFRICKVVCACIAAALLFAAPVSVLGAQRVIELQIGNPEMFVDGIGRSIDDVGSAPQIIDGRTFVPIRPIVEVLRGDIIWDAELQILTIRDYLGEHEIILKINSRDSVVNAEAGPRLDAAPMLMDNITLAPIVFVAQNLGFDTEWDEETRTITITANT